MSMFKKIKLFTLTCILGTGLVGCGSKTLKDGVENPSEILSFAKTANVFESSNNKISTNIETIINNQPFNISMNFDTLYSEKQQKISLNTSIAIGQNTNTTSIYLNKDGEIYNKYINRGNEWKKEEATLEEFNNILLSSSEPMYFDELIASANAFSVTENDETYTLSGKVKVSDIEETLQYIGVLNMLSTINMDLEQINKDSDVNLSLEIQKGTGYLKNVSIDIMDAASESLAKSVIDLINLPLDSFKLEISNFSIDLNFDNVNQVDNIEIPKEALDAQ